MSGLSICLTVEGGTDSDEADGRGCRTGGWQRVVGGHGADEVLRRRGTDDDAHRSGADGAGGHLARMSGAGGDLARESGAGGHLARGSGAGGVGGHDAPGLSADGRGRSAGGVGGRGADVHERAAEGGANQPWVSAQQRWSEAAELLRTAGRAPVDLREWLGPGWSGDAADKYGQWGAQFADATRRASVALTDAAASAASISTRGPDATQYLLPQADLDALDSGVRRISAVLVPGQRVGGQRQRQVPRRHNPGPQRPSQQGRSQQSPARRPGGVMSPADRHEKVQGWIDQATDILHQKGYTDDQIDRDAIATIIRYESNGNPSAVNGHDSNAARGNPSSGLMQTIPSTFRHYALPGHTQILDPVDNIVAGVRYAVRRYGSVSNVPGVKAVAAGHGYVGY